MDGGFPEVEGGGSLILAWQIKRKNVLVVGGGEVSTSRCADKSQHESINSSSKHSYANKVFNNRLQPDESSTS